MSAIINNLISAAVAERESRRPPKDEPVISVSTRTSRASFVYERMRTAVDYKEEHLIRRTAIERILRRLLASGQLKNLAENLVHELIHARYLPNKAVPQRKLAELTGLIDKYLRLFGLAPSPEILNEKTLAGWTLSIMASEIDEFLMPPYVMHASINAMYEVMARVIHLEEPLPTAERGKQIYLATSRTLYHNEENLRYHLLLLYYPEWRRATPELVRSIGNELSSVRLRLEADLAHPAKKKLVTVLRKQVVYFSILTEIIAKDPEGAAASLADSRSLAEKIFAACGEHYRRARSKLRRSIGRSVIYLVLTKFLLAFILEIPVEFLLLKHYNLWPLFINLVFPPALLTIIALSTKIPDQANSQLIAAGIEAIIQGKEEMIQVPKTKTRGLVLQFLFVLLYGALFVVSFGLLIYGLNWLDFSLVGMLVFLLFLSLVSLFAYRIRRNTQELFVTPPQRGMIRSLWGFMTIPILHAGKWMSGKFAKINIFIFILDFVIEAPFKSFLKITEEWMSYVHEKKEEI